MQGLKTLGGDNLREIQLCFNIGTYYVIWPYSVMINMFHAGDHADECRRLVNYDNFIAQCYCGGKYRRRKTRKRTKVAASAFIPFARWQN